ncbi:MAG: NADH-quinone oxidoreductase subunit E [Candidatus Pseudothioglobus sp.]|jgi:NADH-quinone oxidoreductase subunit E
MHVATDNIIDSLSMHEVDEIETLVSHLPDRQSAAIDALKIVQQHRGWISDQSLSAIANLLGMSTAALDAIATFYNLIYRRPVGEQVILVCDSVSCWIMDGDSVCESIQSRLQIGLGETTADGKYTLLPVTCLGACDHAPTMMVGDTLHADLTVDSINEVFK